MSSERQHFTLQFLMVVFYSPWKESIPFMQRNEMEIELSVPF